MISSETRFAVEDLYADYAATLDERRYGDWLALFDDDCRYTVRPRENEDAGLPLATLQLESKGMLRDRIQGVTDTIYHAPYYQRHIVSGLRLTPDGEAIIVRANYLIIRTHLGELSEVFNAGRYEDQLVHTSGQWRFRSKLCVFDSELVPNSLIYPV